jgi:hypothetical protein
MSTVAYGRCQHTITLELANELDNRARIMHARSQDHTYTRAQRAHFARSSAALHQRATNLRNGA